MKANNIFPILAIAAGALLIKRNRISGVGATDQDLALQMLDEAGIDIRQSYHELDFAELQELHYIMKIVGYKAPSRKVRSEAPVYYFWRYLRHIAQKNGVFGVSEATKEDELNGWRVYSWVLMSPDLFEKTYSVFMQDRTNHGWPAMQNIFAWLKVNMPAPYHNLSEEAYEIAAYNLAADYFAIHDRKLDRETAFKQAAAELEAARQAYLSL